MLWIWVCCEIYTRFFFTDHCYPLLVPKNWKTIEKPLMPIADTTKNHRCGWCENFSKTIDIPLLGKYYHHHSIATKNWPSFQSRGGLIFWWICRNIPKTTAFTPKNGNLRTLFCQNVASRILRAPVPATPPIDLLPFSALVLFPLGHFFHIGFLHFLH